MAFGFIARFIIACFGFIADFIAGFIICVARVAVMWAAI